MRIGLIVPPWLPVPPSGYGGTEAVIDPLATGLQARGHDVLLFTTGDSTCPVPRADKGALHPRADGPVGRRGPSPAPRVRTPTRRRYRP